MNQFLWERFTSGEELSEEFGHSGGTLSALRRASNRGPAEAPELWPFYTKLQENGGLTRTLKAEHACLVIYGLHQQGQQLAVHNPKFTLGQALRNLRTSDRFSADAIDSKVVKLANASQLDDMAYHLRGLVSLMKVCTPPITFNYTRLYHDFIDVQDELTLGQVRRRWGSAYFYEPKTTK